MRSNVCSRSERERNHGAERKDSRTYHFVLLGLLGIATLYEGFDASMLTLASVDVRATLHIGLDEWGTLYAITRAGMIASFFFLMCADRFGRKNLLLITVAGFAIATAATAFVQTKFEFMLWQTLARLFLTAQYGLAIIIAGEELPARLRGTGITILTGFATVGTVAMAKTSPFFLLLRRRRQSGARFCDGVRRRRVELVRHRGRWRALARPLSHRLFPLFLLPFLALGVRETTRFARSPRPRQCVDHRRRSARSSAKRAA